MDQAWVLPVFAKVNIQECFTFCLDPCKVHRCLMHDVRKDLGIMSQDFYARSCTIFLVGH